MNTPMQEHIEWLKKEWQKLDDLGIALHIGDCIEHAQSMLEKEKFGGIQWNKYPDSKPEEGQYVDIITKCRRRLTDCEVEKDGFYDREGGVFYEHSHVTHWAEINLPNQ